MSEICRDNTEKKKKKNKPVRVGVVIYTPNGVLLVKDRKDHNVIKDTKGFSKLASGLAPEQASLETLESLGKIIDIFSKGRYSLPGGHIDQEDFEKEQAMEIFGVPEKKMDLDQRKKYIQVVTRAAIREIMEELQLEVDPRMINVCKRISGDFRDHIILTMYTHGKLVLKLDEIDGIGFLRDKGTLPLTATFVQRHVIIINSYINTHRAEKISRGFQSRLEVRQDLVQDWLNIMEEVYRYRTLSTTGSHRIPNPEMPVSSPNFHILDQEENIIESPPCDNLNGNKRVRVARHASMPDKHRKNRSKRLPSDITIFDADNSPCKKESDDCQAATTIAIHDQSPVSIGTGLSSSTKGLFKCRGFKDKKNK